MSWIYLLMGSCFVLEPPAIIFDTSRGTDGNLFKRYVDLSMPFLKGAGELEVAPLCPYRLFLPCVRHRDRRPRSKGQQTHFDSGCFELYLR